MNIRTIPAELVNAINSIYAALTPEQQAYTTIENVAAVIEASRTIWPSAPPAFDPVSSVVKFNVDAGNTAHSVNVRQSALYLGLQFEELGEKATSVGLHAVGDHMANLAQHMKKGSVDEQMSKALADPERARRMLDDDVDLIVVSIGAAISQGADIHGALRVVCRANDAKRNAAGVLEKDANGKIKKPSDWTPPDLSAYTIV